LSSEIYNRAQRRLASKPKGASGSTHNILGRLCNCVSECGESSACKGEGGMGVGIEGVSISTGERDTGHSGLGEWVSR
jgi:hypothetical protein